MKSTITCDMEGRIQTFNKGAEEIFGYSAEEVVGKARVSLFSPGLVVLGHVGDWLAAADERGEFVGESVFERKDGSRFAAKIRITPTRRKGERLGYCGVTEPLEGVDPQEAMPPISLATRLLAALVITRAPFLSAVLVPVALAAGWCSYAYAEATSWAYLPLVILGAIALHIAANTFNDYFDWQAGTDQANTDYFQGFSGGSRAIELRLISQRGLLWLASSFALVGAAIGATLMALRGWEIAAFGLFGLLSAYFYTAPPLRLVARRGLGELLIALNFGPLVTAGAVFALTGQAGWADFLIGVPVGLLTVAILWINQFPDADSDASTGKNHGVVTLGKDVAKWLYPCWILAAYAVTIAAVVAGAWPPASLALLGGAPIFVYASRVLFRHLRDRELVRACVATIALHAVSGALMTIGLFLAS